MGGGGFSMEPDNPLLDDFILSLTRKRKPKVCFVPTASGDSDNYIARFYRAFPASRCAPSHLPLFHGNTPDLTRFVCAQDVVYVGGGSTANTNFSFGALTGLPEISHIRILCFSKCSEIAGTLST